MVIYNGPTGERIENPNEEFIKDIFYNKGDEYWKQGSGDSCLEVEGWYDRFVEALPRTFLVFFYILDEGYNQCKEDDLGGFLGAISPEIWEDGKPIDKAIFNDWQKICKPETINENNIIKRTYDFLVYYEKKFDFNFSKTKRWLISIADKEIVKKALKGRMGI